MAKIVYRPYDEIIVHEILEFPLQNLLEFLVSQMLSQGQAGLTPVANWTDDIAFSIGNFMETPDLVKEKMEGRIHWGAVYFARTSYQPEKKVTIGSREYVVKFARADSNPDFVSLARFLNNFERPPSSPSSSS